ncbi:MAG TPA: glycosyltransferase [Solirubrobacterales bacterium]|nr:glycosyltransferase [Solirubrobacterales bacterium]
MKVVVFSHSLVSDWNHGNAHFLRGVVSELRGRGHRVEVFEPADGWSRANLEREHGAGPLRDFETAFPDLSSREYDLRTLDLGAALEDAELVLVHEWNDPALVKRIGDHRARHGGYRLLFHDTHHRAATAPEEMARFDLSEYDGVLAYGEVIRRIYLECGWARRAWTWHEAADTRVFQPLPGIEPERDLVWIGNWGDDERSAELHEFLLRPARKLGLRGSIHGVRYPRPAQIRIRLAGLRYRGWVANHRAPELFARHRLTVHVPRRPYVQALPGIPTIRPFEAMACGIPLICSPWEDAEGLFRPGQDYLLVRDGKEMREAMRAVLADPELAAWLRANGLETVRGRHTCAHRVDELLAIEAELRGAPPPGQTQRSLNFGPHRGANSADAENQPTATR